MTRQNFCVCLSIWMTLILNNVRKCKKILLEPIKKQSKCVNVEMNSGNGIGLFIECEKANYNFISYESIIK